MKCMKFEGYFPPHKIHSGNQSTHDRYINRHTTKPRPLRIHETHTTRSNRAQESVISSSIVLRVGVYYLVCVCLLSCLLSCLPSYRLLSYRLLSCLLSCLQLVFSGESDFTPSRFKPAPDVYLKAARSEGYAPKVVNMILPNITKTKPSSVIRHPS